jgi:HlyD family secretion protein
MPNPKKRRKLIIFSIIALVLVALTLAAVFRKREVVITVQTDKVKRRDLTELVVANGKIQPVLQVKISPEVSGEIIELPVKEGQPVKKGDLILKIKPDFYIASRNQAEASYRSALASKSVSEANLAKAESEFKRNDELFKNKLISESVFTEMETAFTIAKAQLTSATHQIEMSKAQLARAEDDLSKTTIVSPLDGTISKLNSQVGERVVGTATMAGTDVMTIADLNEMEARVDIGEMDVVLIKPGQRARLEVDAFKDRKFSGTVTEIANSAKGAGVGAAASQSTDATKFEVRIRIGEKENFRPGMSVNTEIETRYRTNALTVPIAAVTTRLPKPANTGTNSPSGTQTNSALSKTTNSPAATNSPAGTNGVTGDKKSKEAMKPMEVVFVVEAEKVKQAPVKLGVSDADYYEIVEGLSEGQEIVTGNYKAVNKELEDGKKVIKGGAVKGEDKEKK